MEDNVYEAARVNIIGTDNVLRLSSKYKVKSCLLISSDKAVNPTSVMGATKRIAEKLLLKYAKEKNNSSVFSAVRFGNVLGSRGSVVPVLIQQIKNGGPVTITHPEIYRYFMTISEAVSLVLNSILISEGREIFVLDMGEQVKIVDLAKNLIILSGLKPGKDIQIIYTGLRPGEKLYEEMLTSEDMVSSTKMKKIFIAHPEKIDTEFLMDNIKKINLILNSPKEADKPIRKIIKKLAPEFLGYS